MMKMDYSGQRFGSRLVVKNDCCEEDWIRIGATPPRDIAQYVLTKCENCGTLIPATIKAIRRQPPKRCAVCSNIGNRHKAETIRNAWAVNGDTAVCNVVFHDSVVSIYIDADDYPLAAGFTWRISQKRQKYYAITGSQKKGTMKYLHQLIFGEVSDGHEIDHIDGNSLNNRKENLREVTHAENVKNITATRIDNAIGIRGVSYDKKSRKYVVDFSADGNRLYVKPWNTVEEAVWCRRVLEDIFGMSMAASNPLVPQYDSLSNDKKSEIKQYALEKYSEMSGNEVYTPVKTYSKERKAEFLMREWEDVNQNAD